MSLPDFLQRLQRALESAGVSHMLTGSVAAATHGAERSTLDVDIVIAPDRAQLALFLEQFPEDRYYLSREAANEAFKNSAQFNVIDDSSGWKVDFIFRKERAFSRAEFERRRSKEVLGVEMSVASLEDVMVAKLEWARSAKSARQLEDVAKLLSANQTRVDLAYVERWVQELNVLQEWTEAQRLAKS